MHGCAETGAVPIQEAPALATLVDMPAHSIQNHGPLSGGIELRHPEVLRPRKKLVLPYPEHFIDGVERVDLELVVGILAGDKDLQVIFLVDLRIPLGECAPHIGLFGPESEVEIVVVPQQGYPRVDRKSTRL